MCRSEGCAGWLRASEANGTHRCGGCELVPPVVFQAGQWPATRKPGDRDRDALILLPLDARQTQTAGRGGADRGRRGVRCHRVRSRVSWRRSGMGCRRRMLPRSLQSHRFRQRPGAGPRHASRCRCPGPVAQTEPGEGAGLANDRVVASGEVLQADDLAVFEDCEVQVPVVRRPVPAARPVLLHHRTPAPPEADRSGTRGRRLVRFVDPLRREVGQLAQFLV
jgi:hypothetical protein